jgi:translocator assembly and maintenance protein 41
MVKMESGSIQSLLKYGVISTSKLKNDLKEWDSLYIAGRMQKPTSILSICDDEIIEIQEKHNLRYALSAALLLLPEEELRRDFQLPASKVFESLAELSYIGDPRIKAGAEDPLKISKLVHSPGQLQRFQSMYRGEFTRLQSMGILSIGNGGKNIEINTHDQGTRRALAARLPSKLQNQTVDEKHQLSSSFLRQSLARIVSRPAQIQSGKGIVTAGVYKSILYAGAKLAKGAFSGR